MGNSALLSLLNSYGRACGQLRYNMKPQAVKTKALKLFLEGIAIYRIAKQLHIAHKTVYQWMDEGNWKEKKEEAIEKAGDKVTERIIQKQIEIVDMAQAQLDNTLKKQEEIKSQINELNTQIKALDAKEDKEDRLELYSMMNVLVKQLLEVKDLISVMKHGLQVVRPKETVSNLNINAKAQTIQVNIPKEVIALIEKENNEEK